jgi:hypothetical protein
MPICDPKQFCLSSQHRSEVSHNRDSTGWSSSWLFTRIQSIMKWSRTSFILNSVRIWSDVIWTMFGFWSFCSFLFKIWYLLCRGENPLSWKQIVQHSISMDSFPILLKCARSVHTRQCLMLEKTLHHVWIGEFPLLFPSQIESTKISLVRVPESREISSIRVSENPPISLVRVSETPKISLVGAVWKLRNICYPQAAFESINFWGEIENPIILNSQLTN